FRFVQAINFRAPKVKVEPAAAAPDTMTAAVTEAVRLAGAAPTADVEIAPASTEADMTLPRRAKKPRSFSKARAIRFCAASSFVPRACPIKKALMKIDPDAAAKVDRK